MAFQEEVCTVEIHHILRRITPFSTPFYASPTPSRYFVMSRVSLCFVCGVLHGLLSPSPFDTAQTGVTCLPLPIAYALQILMPDDIWHLFMCNASVCC